ncbi:hypothetical protein NEOLEDRAFT_1113526, partial [Neolentinus lepideus HHB14362 ss-1]
RKWSLKRFLEELFNYCFPVNFRTIQRERYLAYRQDGHSIRDYKRHLEELADSVGNISKRDFVIRFWQGADKYLRVQWAKDGYDPEKSKILDLQESGERYEQS